jgi:hypothetical protein
MSNPRVWPNLLLLWGLCIAVGCSAEQGPKNPKCYPVSGRVLVDGKPAVRAVVSFHPTAPQEDGKISVGQTMTDDDGKFRMTTFSAGDGAPKGDYIVTIVASWVVKEGHDVPVPDLLKGEYATKEKSTLKATVGEVPVERPVPHRGALAGDLGGPIGTALTAAVRPRGRITTLCWSPCLSTAHRAIGTRQLQSQSSPLAACSEFTTIHCGRRLC